MEGGRALRGIVHGSLLKQLINRTIDMRPIDPGFNGQGRIKVNNYASFLTIMFLYYQCFCCSKIATRVQDKVNSTINMN